MLFFMDTNDAVDQLLGHAPERVHTNYLRHVREVRVSELIPLPDFSEGSAKEHFRVIASELLNGNVPEPNLRNNAFEGALQFIGFPLGLFQEHFPLFSAEPFLKRFQYAGAGFRMSLSAAFYYERKFWAGHTIAFPILGSPVGNQGFERIPTVILKQQEGSAVWELILLETHKFLVRTNCLFPALHRSHFE